jgi:hypothetical protein
MRGIALLAAVGTTLNAATCAMAGANCDREIVDFFDRVGPDIEQSSYLGDFSAASFFSEDADVSDAFFFAHPYYVGYVEAIDAGYEVDPAKFLATDAVIECLAAHPELSLAPEEIIGWAAQLDETVSKTRRAELRLVMQSR